MRSVLTALCLFTTTAHAVPAQFTHQGRLLDADGIPLEGEVNITFRVITEETGGEVLWQEPITVDLNAGFYAAVLGTDEETNPLDTEVLSQAPVWLELQIDGEPAMFPRSAINAVPYATMATVAEEVSGGPVDASQIAVDGTPVVNELGEWVGPAPTVNWSDIEGMPEDFADGTDDDTDTDTDSFAALGTSCLDGDIPVWDGILIEWACGIDNDTVLTDDEVDAIVADNGYAMESELFSSSFLDLTDVPEGLDDGDDNTQLTESEVDAMVADNGYAMAADAFSRLWSDLTGIPDDLADGDDVLSEDDVDAMVADNDYATSSDVAVLLAEIDTLKAQVAELGDSEDGTGTVMYGDYNIYNSVDLEGLEGFTEIHGNLGIHARALPNLEPLSSLTKVTIGISINEADALTDFTGLNNLVEVGGHFTVTDSDSLTSLEGLESLTTIGGDFTLAQNNAMTSLEGAESLSVVSGSVDIRYNDALTTLNGINSLSTVGLALKIDRNNALVSIEGLESLTNLGGQLRVGHNPELISLNGLEALNSIGAYISIVWSDSLVSISALHGLSEVGDEINIGDNASLCETDATEFISIMRSKGWARSDSLYRNSGPC